jgi:NAD(P)-dependent dehydrogenase (short-subunit alcohol dehydrogenase family)
MVDQGERELSGKVALVAGATRGAGRAIAVELGRAGAHVYATGRSSRVSGRSEIDRPETIEETGELVEAAGGSATALVVDHEDPSAVAALVERIESEHGRLDVLVNDMFGGDRYARVPAGLLGLHRPVRDRRAERTRSGSVPVGARAVRFCLRRW